MAKPSRNNAARPAPATPKPLHPPTTQTASALNMSWSGPLPPPGALQQFNEIIPDGAERIMRMVETEQAHRIAHETKLLDAMTRDTKRGHWLGGTISILAVGGAVVSVALHAHPTVSIALVSVPVLGMVRAMLENKTSKPAENKPSK
jgi:uncharacterized membrane protein